MAKRYVNKNVILLLDNVRYHHTKRVKALIEKLHTKITFKYLPPYSSELNAIEHLWKDIRLNVTHNHLFEGISKTMQAITKYFMNIKRNPAKIKRLCGFIF